MNESFSLQDCDRKTPPRTYPVVFVNNKPSGLDLKVNKGTDPRTHRPIVYTVSLTPAVMSGAWESPEDKGGIEQVRRFATQLVIRFEGIWIETGERSIMVVELPVPNA